MENDNGRRLKASVARLYRDLAKPKPLVIHHPVPGGDAELACIPDTVR
jgi:hypothetical protein